MVTTSILNADAHVRPHISMRVVMIPTRTMADKLTTEIREILEGVPASKRVTVELFKKHTIPHVDKLRTTLFHISRKTDARFSDKQRAILTKWLISHNAVSQCGDYYDESKDYFIEFSNAFSFAIATE